MDSSEGDEQLLRQVSRGDREALRQLYRRHGRRVYSLAFHIVGDEARAEEITQDVFLKVWEKAGSFDPAKAQPMTWMLRITRNRSIDVWRREKPRAELPGDLESPTDGPEETWAKASLATGVRDELARLPTAQRRALSMAYYAGLTHSEIARTLGEPLGTVKSRIRDALASLRRRLDR